MNFWARLTEGLRIVGLILAGAVSLEVVGGSIQLPPVVVTYQDRKFDVLVTVLRVR